MTLKKLVWTITAAALATGLGACGCSHDEVDSQAACTQLTDTLAKALTGCSTSASPASGLCLASCGDSCIKKSDVAACEAAIRAIGCDQLSLDAVKLTESCSKVLDKIIEQDCKSHEDDDGLPDD